MSEGIDLTATERSLFFNKRRTDMWNYVRPNRGGVEDPCLQSSLPLGLLLYMS